MQRIFYCLFLIVFAGTPVSAEEGTGAKKQREAKNMESKYEIEIIGNVKYTEGNLRPKVLDIVRPKGELDKPMPVLIWIHGGGWAGGDKGFGVARLKPFAEKGYFCVTISYTLTGQAIFPAQIEDCKCAVRFLRAHAEKYNLDADRIGVWGSSAGGHLSLLLGSSAGIKELEGSRGWPKFSSRVQAVCSFTGPADISKMTHLPHAAVLIGGPIEKNLEKAARASPVTYVSKDDPPFLMIQGTKDPLVPHEQGVIMKEALKKAKVPVELVSLEGAGHGGPRFDGPDIQKKITEFFDKHLRPTIAK